MILTDLHRIISTDESENGKELFDMGRELGVYPHLLCTNEFGGTWYPITWKMAQKLMVMKRAGKVAIFKPEVLDRYIVKGKKINLHYDKKGKVKYQMI